MNDKIKLARQIALVAAGFAALMAVLLIANYIQTRLNDPIENKTIPALIKRLNASPEDEALKTEIRAATLVCDVYRKMMAESVVIARRNR